MLAKAGGFRKFPRAIVKFWSIPPPQGNPYRALLRRDFPEPFVALLAFVLGIWLWDHYFGPVGGYAPGTERMALVKLDRDLRLAEAMEGDPPWLRWLAGAEEPATVRQDALAGFVKLAAEEEITPLGREALAVLQARQAGLPVRTALADLPGGRAVSGFEETSRRLAGHRGTWWQAEMISAIEETERPFLYWRRAYDEDTIRLRDRALASRGSVWLLGLGGLAFVPAALRRLRAGPRGSRRRGYGSGWPMKLGLVVFMVATLAWIGFNLVLELGISALHGVAPPVWICLDSAARVLPALIAIALLFRRPTHAARVLGLGPRVDVPCVMGIFSALMVVDFLLNRLQGGGLSVEPGGGLSVGEVGLWGLAFAVISSCLLAPLAEETLYRGVLFRSFRNRLGLPAAALASSAIFALLHFYDGFGLLSVGIFGFSCALLYAGTGSLTTTIALHALYNGAIKIPEWIVYHAPFR